MASEAPTSGSTVDYRDLLDREKLVLQSQLTELGFGESDGLSYDPNFADSSQVTAERGEAETLAKELSDALGEVEAAMRRLQDGTYGRCEKCGTSIAQARLEAMPTARLCITCASK
ncbi:MAG: TraR/DksA family transcriptional regulator [Acidimicrobiales bacterium]|jgi:RNA polymerase-binding transcription factor DksA